MTHIISKPSSFFAKPLRFAANYNALILSLLIIVMTCTILPNAVAGDDDGGLATPEESSVVTVRSQLRDIVTSDDYVEISESQKRVPKPSEKPSSSSDHDFNAEDWFNDKSSSTNSSTSSLDLAAPMSVMLKYIIIALLIAFIIWVALRASGKVGWGKKIFEKSKHKSTVNDYDPMQLSQGWEELPPHHQVPSVVMTLVQNKDYELAGSILYRAALRWLSSSHDLNIAPATTEMQCIKQIEHLNKLGVAIEPSLSKSFNASISSDAQQQSKPMSRHSISTLEDEASEYIIELIKIWMQVAYNSNRLMNLTNEQLSQRIKQLCDNWLTQLPIKQLSKQPPSILHQPSIPQQPSQKMSKETLPSSDSKTHENNHQDVESEPDNRRA